MRVLITGVAGFLGSHLAKHYLDAGHEVIGYDNFCSSSRSSAHLSSLKDKTWFSFVEHDITEPFVSHRHLDLILNFACPASPPIYQSLPIETLMTCTLGTKHVLDVAKQHGAIVVHASTSEVYGDPFTSPQVETDRGNVNSYGPRACYDEGKRAAEALCYDYFHKKNVDVRLVRIFNTYGPHMDPNDGRVISNFICQALKNEPLTIYGDGIQTRSLCYVDDLVRGIVAMGNLSKNPQTPINLGNPTEYDVIDIADIIIDKLGGTKKYVSLPIDDPMQRRPDITLAIRTLDWKPMIDFNSGLEKTIEYFKTALK